MSQAKNRYLAERWVLTAEEDLRAAEANGLPDLTPGQVYRLEDATRGLEAARGLVQACRQWIAEH